MIAVGWLYLVIGPDGHVAFYDSLEWAETATRQGQQFTLLKILGSKLETRP